MSGVSIYLGGGLSYNKKDGSFMNWDNKNSSSVLFHRSSIGSIESYNTPKGGISSRERPSGFGVLFKTNTGNIILNLKLDTEKELREFITKISDPDLDIFKDHNRITEETLILLLSELKNFKFNEETYCGHC